MVPAPGPTESRPGHDFSQIPIHQSAGGAGTASGKVGASVADDEVWGLPITGDGGSASRPRAAPTAAGAPAVAALPKLKKSTVGRVWRDDCGEFRWIVQWELDRKTTKGGWVVQEVQASRNVKDCAGRIKGPDKTPGKLLDPSQYPVWEAWEIHKDQKVTTDAERGDPKDDTFAARGAPGTKGVGEGLKIKGRAEYYDGLTLPDTFKATYKPPTRDLPVTRSAPKLAGGTGAISHNLTATWDCCTPGADKTTKLTME